jgi:hypothetical protein
MRRLSRFFASLASLIAIPFGTQSARSARSRQSGSWPAWLAAPYPPGPQVQLLMPSTAYPHLSRLPHLPHLPHLPQREQCSDWQWRAIELADEYGVVAHRCFTPTARGTQVQLYLTIVVGDGYGYACSPEEEYQPGKERWVRVEYPQRQYQQISCGCTLGKRQDPCPHAGAVLLYLM